MLVRVFAEQVKNITNTPIRLAKQAGKSTLTPSHRTAPSHQSLRGRPGSPACFRALSAFDAKNRKVCCPPMPTAFGWEQGVHGVHMVVGGGAHRCDGFQKFVWRVEVWQSLA